jgi:hypothetical protein
VTSLASFAVNSSFARSIGLNFWSKRSRTVSIGTVGELLLRGLELEVPRVHGRLLIWAGVDSGDLEVDEDLPIPLKQNELGDSDPLLGELLDRCWRLKNVSITICIESLCPRRGINSKMVVVGGGGVRYI